MTIEAKIKELNDRYLLQVRKILVSKAYIFTRFREATLKEDQEQGFDAVLSFPDVKIPIRIRKNSYLRFMDFTVRSRSKFGMKTEIHKLKEGFGDFYFYAWSDESEKNISTYMILDLNVFRQTLIDKPTKIDVPNGDGTCFNVYSREELLKNRVIKLIEHL